MLSTVQDMNQYVLVELNKANQGTIPPPRFDIVINAAMMQWVKNKYQVMDRDEQAMDALRVLIPAPLVIANTGAAAPSQESFALPYVAAPAPGTSHGYLYMVNCAVRLFTGTTPVPVPCRSEDGWVSARPLRRDALNEISRRPFSKPTDQEPYYILSGNQFGVRAGATSFAQQARIEYIRYPVRISLVNLIQPELPPVVNQEIADLAVRNYLEITQNPRYRTRLNEDQLKA